MCQFNAGWSSIQLFEAVSSRKKWKQECSLALAELSDPIEIQELRFTIIDVV